MFDRDHALPVSQQVRLVHIAGRSAYYRAAPVSEADERLTPIDDLDPEFPFARALIAGASAARLEVSSNPRLLAYGPRDRGEACEDGLGRSEARRRFQA